MSLAFFTPPPQQQKFGIHPQIVSVRSVGYSTIGQGVQSHPHWTLGNRHTDLGPDRGPCSGLWTGSSPSLPQTREPLKDIDKRDYVEVWVSRGEVSSPHCWKKKKFECIGVWIRGIAWLCPHHSFPGTAWRRAKRELLGLWSPVEENVPKGTLPPHQGGRLWTTGLGVGRGWESSREGSQRSLRGHGLHPLHHRALQEARSWAAANVSPGDPPAFCEPCPHTLCRALSGLQKNRAQSSYKDIVFVLRYL